MKLRDAVTIASLLVLLGGCSAGAPDTGSARQSEVADKGRSVMPFDLDKTTHRFTPTGDGLLEQVVADHVGDTVQTGLIRQHLEQQAQRFRKGDFGDPASIHGPNMPGLTALSAGAARIMVAYAQLPDGAALTFSTTDSALVAALHEWGAAQVSDHGRHAESGPARSHNHP